MKAQNTSPKWKSKAKAKQEKSKENSKENSERKALISYEETGIIFKV